jgi:hypothetical protein
MMMIAAPQYDDEMRVMLSYCGLSFIRVPEMIGSLD